MSSRRWRRLLPVTLLALAATPAAPNGSRAAGPTATYTDPPGGGAVTPINGAYSGVLAGTGALDVLTGTTILTGQNTAVGTTTISPGATLRIGDGGPTGRLFGDVANNGTLVFDRNRDAVVYPAGSSSQVLGLTSLGGTGDVRIERGRLGLLTPVTYMGGTYVASGADLYVIGQPGTNAPVLTGSVVNEGTIGFWNTYAGTPLRPGTPYDHVADHDIVLVITPTGGIGLGSVISSGADFTFVFPRQPDFTVETPTGTALLYVSSGTSAPFAGTISGSGSVNIRGAAAFATDQTYTGLTTIPQYSSLTIGTGGTAGAIAGPIRNDGTLTFNRSDAITVPGTISGLGSVNVAAGTVTLTANNTYVGGTFLYPGSTLRLGDGGTTGSILGGVEGTGNLIVNRSDATTLDGEIRGAINLTMVSGTLNLTRANYSTGTTTIAPGTAIILSGLGHISGPIANDGLLRYARNDIALLPRALSGSGALEVASGALVVAGDATHTGGTVIAPGARLQVGLGGTGGTLGGTVVNGGTFGVSRSDDVTLAASVSGLGIFRQDGTGRLTIADAQPYTGATVVASGTLVVNGSIAASSGLTVLNGATVGGTGTLPTTMIAAGGTLAPGPSPGTLTVAGNLFLSPGSTTTVGVQRTASDRINVAGTAALDGTLRVVSLGGPYAFNVPYTLLSAAAGRGGTFAAIQAGGFGAGVTPTVTYAPTSVQLALAPVRLIPDPPPPPGQPSPGPPPPDPPSPDPTPPAGVASVPAAPVLPGFEARNTRQVALALDRARVAGDDLTPYFAAYNQPASIIAAAVNSLGGEVSTATTSMGALTGGGFLATLLDAHPVSSEAGIGRRVPLAGGLSTTGVAVWGQATGAAARTAGEASTGSVTRSDRAAGFALGLDVPVAPNLIAGAAVAIGEAAASVSGGGRANASFGQVGLHARLRAGPLTLGAAAGLSFLDVDTKRTVAVLGQEQRGETDARVWSGRIETRHDGVRVGAGEEVTLHLQPFAAFQAQSVRTDGFTERPTSGPTTGIRVSAGRNTIARLELGAEARTAVSVGAVPLDAFARVAWARYVARDVSAEASLLAAPGGGAFAITGARPDRDAALIGIGAEARIAPGLRLAGWVDGEVSSRVRAVTGSLRLTYAF